MARAWRIARVLSDRMPSTVSIDQLLDERAHAGPRASTGEFSTSCDKHLAAKELELIDWDAAESRAYIQGWLGGTEVTVDKHHACICGREQDHDSGTRPCRADDSRGERSVRMDTRRGRR